MKKKKQDILGIIVSLSKVAVWITALITVAYISVYITLGTQYLSMLFTNSILHPILASILALLLFYWITRTYIYLNNIESLLLEHIEDSTHKRK